MITRETDYAIRALLRLAQQGDGQVVSTTVLAEDMEIPYRFLRRIVLKLGERELVQSTRGKQGGLRLARPADDVTLLDIVDAMDPESITLNICLGEENACPRSERCVVHNELAEIQQMLRTRFAEISLATLVERDRQRESHPHP
ncbi:MAG: RrF2 family transcriptional regulator [Armatimonadota bacterium]